MEVLGGDAAKKGFSVDLEDGFNALEDILEGHLWVSDIEALRKLPAGSLVRDERGRTLFKTQANGWVTTASTHVSTMYVRLPAEVLHREA